MGRRIAFLYFLFASSITISIYLFLCAMTQEWIFISSSLFLPTLLLLIFIFLLCLLFYRINVFWLNKHFLKPMHELSDLCQHLSSMDFKPQSKHYQSPAINELQQHLIALSQQMQDNLSNLKILNSYVSHEVKNSISIIHAQIQLGAGKEELLSAIHHIISGIENILALSEIKSETITETIDLSLIAAMVVDDYSKKYKDIELIIEDSVSLVYGKQHLFYCAISNLVDNAIKYGNQKPIQVIVSEKNNTVSVCIEDHGIGIPQKQLDKIFEPNYRISSLKKDSYGVGLSLVKNVVEVTGGTIWVDSVYNQGTRFILVLPSIQS